MRELKAHQPPMTVDEQIVNLREKGLIIENEDYARPFLNDVSYFRLIKAYSLGLKERNGSDGKQYIHHYRQPYEGRTRLLER